MNHRRDFMRLTGASALALATGAMLGRGANAQIPIWLNTPFHGGDATAMEIIVKQLNEQQKDIRLDLTQGGWTEYYAQLYNAVVAGVAPNIGICHNFRFSTSAPILYDLEDTPVGNVIETTGFTGDKFIPHAWQLCQYDGKQYGIPLDQNMLGFYYNKAIFREAGLDPETPPGNHEEFEAACEAILKVGKIPFHPALSSAPRWIRRAWYIMYWSMDGALIEGDASAFNNDEGRAALQYLVDMVGSRGWNKPATDANNQFLANELGMCLNGTWFYLTVDRAGIDYGSGLIPQFFDRRVTWGTTHNLVLPKQPEGADNEERLQASVDALKLLVPDTYLWGQYGGHVPMYKAALEDERLRESDTWKMTLQYFADMAFSGVFQTTPDHPNVVAFEAAIEPPIQEAYNGTISVEDALDQAEEAGNAALAG
jgi:multiple sugar transport system substrate-binding protein